KLAATAPDLARDLRVAVQETLEQALRRREESIRRMIDLEAKTLEREKKRLVETSLFRVALTEHERRLLVLMQPPIPARCRKTRTGKAPCRSGQKMGHLRDALRPLTFIACNVFG